MRGGSIPTGGPDQKDRLAGRGVSSAGSGGGMWLMERRLQGSIYLIYVFPAPREGKDMWHYERSLLLDVINGNRTFSLIHVT